MILITPRKSPLNELERKWGEEFGRRHGVRAIRAEDMDRSTGRLLAAALSGMKGARGKRPPGLVPPPAA